jgi:UDP-glucose 4-epimerase
VWGDGTARKDFLHHTDFVAALEQIVRTRPIGIFNVSSGHSHTVREVISLAEEALGKRVKLQHVPAHSWDVHDSLLDNAKLRNAVLWKPTLMLREGIQQAVAEKFRPS